MTNAAAFAPLSFRFLSTLVLVVSHGAFSLAPSRGESRSTKTIAEVLTPQLPLLGDCCLTVAEHDLGR